MAWSAIALRRSATRFIDRGTPIPVPSESDAAATIMTNNGATLTIKQRSSAWLPGGVLKIHIDDITSGQVLISVTDTGGKVVVAPKSIKQNDQLLVSDMQVKLVRLKNVAIGSGDFAEFEVTPLRIEE